MSSDTALLISYDGMRFPAFPALERDLNFQMNTIQNLEYFEDDVLLCSFPKSGTHWIWEILNMLKTGIVELSSEQFENYHLESKNNILETKQLRRPRVLSTHLLYRYLPKEHKARKSKIVRMLRDPRDVLISLFHHTNRHKKFNSLATNFDRYHDFYLSEEFPFAGWFNYHIDWEKECKQIDGNHILTLFYEECKEDEVEAVRKMAEFLGVTYPEEVLREIARKSSFQSMSKHKCDTSSERSKDGKAFIYRKGKVGDWKTVFTSEQAEVFDQTFIRKMKDTDLFTKYGPL